VSTDLALGDWANPGDRKIEADDNGSDDPERSRKILDDADEVETEDDGEHDTTEVAASTSEAGYNTVGIGVDVRDIGEVQAVSTLKEDGEQSD